MKLDARRAAAFLRNPGPARIVLLHGEDAGLVRHRAEALTKAVTGAADDPFRVAWLGREDHGRLDEEASAIAMLGGRRVVRVREAGDALAGVVEQVAKQPGDTLVVLEAGGLTRRSKLLTAVEAMPAGAAIACYPESGADLRAAVSARLEAAGIRADPDALDWLQDHLGGDYASTLGEIEKLALYAGEERRLDLDAVRACVGDQASISVDDAVHAATRGDAAATDRAIDRAFAEGMSPVGLLRALLAHMTRLHLVRGRMTAGDPAQAAVKALRPPVFWKREPEMVRAAQAWSAARLTAALAEIRRAELACKQTGAADEVIARRLLTAIASSARRS